MIDKQYTLSYRDLRYWLRRGIVCVEIHPSMVGHDHDMGLSRKDYVETEDKHVGVGYWAMGFQVMEVMWGLCRSHVQAFEKLGDQKMI